MYECKCDTCKFLNQKTIRPGSGIFSRPEVYYYCQKLGGYNNCVEKCAHYEQGEPTLMTK